MCSYSAEYIIGPFLEIQEKRRLQKNLNSY